MQQEKQRLREAVEKRIAAISAKDSSSESRSVCRRVLDALSSDVGAVCAYAALSTEVDLSLLLEEISKEVPLYFPRLESGKLNFRRVHESSDLSKGTHGILEPPADAEELPATGSIVVLVPGRAFDHNGNRLGRGNGGYDHWIAAHRKNPQLQLWGVCFECQLVQAIPVEPHDERMDAVITARGIIRG